MTPLLLASLWVASQGEIPAQAGTSPVPIRFEAARGGKAFWRGIVSVVREGDTSSGSAAMDCPRDCPEGTRGAGLSILRPSEAQRYRGGDEYQYQFSWSRNLAPIAGQRTAPAIVSGGWTLSRSGFFHLGHGDTVTVALPDQVTITFRRAD